MKITQLSVANLRAFEQASFEFDPCFTLLVGVNGVGKTTVLETLRICLSRLLPKFTASRSRPDAFSLDAIQVGASALTVDLDLTIHGKAQHLLIHKQLERSVPHKDGIVREQTLATPDREIFSPDFGKAAKSLKTARTQPVAVYFGTRRSLVSDEQVKTGKARGGQVFAFADALSVARPLRLSEIARWMHAQEELSYEWLVAGLHLDAMRAAARRFLPDCENLRVDMEGGPRLLIEKKGRTLDVRQLSDGERGMLALALDLTQRLSQANPSLDDPVRDGVGVVLIDELDMHLHPLWQRQIMSLLTNTFPNCQFIATTHSPQVIGEVAHDKIQMITDGKVYSPVRSFGIDSSRVLEEVMGAKSRNAGVEKAINEIAKLIGDGKGDEAKVAIRLLAAKIGEDDPEITRACTLLDFMEGDA